MIRTPGFLLPIFVLTCSCLSQVSSFSAIGRSPRRTKPLSLQTSSQPSSSSSSSRLFQAVSSNSLLPEQQHQKQTQPSQYGVGMDQTAMMESDLLVIVDENDQLVLLNENTDSKNEQGTVRTAHTPYKVSKKLAHTFHSGQPRGICHRAFSLFIFDADAKLLLTQRASSKITFPGVWTNTCCSHPLHGMIPNEVDDVAISYPRLDGIKHAAIRKAKHELGLTAMKHWDIHFVSRFHYWAADVLTHGSSPPPGENMKSTIFCFAN